MLEIDSNLAEYSSRPLSTERIICLPARIMRLKILPCSTAFLQHVQKNDIVSQKWLTKMIQNINETITFKLKNLLPQFIDKKLMELFAIDWVDTFFLGNAGTSFVWKMVR